MRITLINQFYPPDLAPTGHMAASLAEHRDGLGDQVTVITSRSSYVGGKEEAPAPAGSGGPRVIRVWGPSLGKGSGLRRIADYAIFYLQALIRMILLSKQDVVISLTTPPFIALTGVAHKALHPTAQLILWSMDCYPEVVERAGVISRGSVASRMMRALNRVIFRHIDDLVCLDPAMAELLTSQYLEDGQEADVHVIPNWEPLSQFPAPGIQAERDARPGDPMNDDFLVLYLGNAGHGHAFRTVLEAARSVQADGIEFLFVGGGAKWPKLERAREEMALTNVTLRDYVDKSETPSVMASANAALITLRSDYAGVISPSKLHSNLAMGLPIVYVGPPGSNVDIAVRTYRCGYSFRHGETEELIAALRRLHSDGAHRAELATNARRAYEAAYSDLRALPAFDLVIGRFRTGSEIKG